MAECQVYEGIDNILGLSISSFPFTYLSISICPKKLPAARFHPLITRFQNLVSHWQTLHISHVGKVILINSIPVAIPTYILVVYFLPDAILDKLVKIGSNSFGVRHTRTAFATKNVLKTPKQRRYCLG